MYSLEARDQMGPAPAYKPTSVLTNHPAFAGVLQDKCAGGHGHVQLVGNQACSRAAAYPRGLCDAVVRGIQIVKGRNEDILAAQKKTVELGVRLFTAHPEDILYEIEFGDMCEQDPSTWKDLSNQKWEESVWSPGSTRDSATGEPLYPDKVSEGCEEYIGFMSQMHVWDCVTRAEAKKDPEGNIVGARWVFVKKVTKPDADWSPRGLWAATSAKTCTLVLTLCLPPGTCSQTVCREAEGPGTEGS